MNFFCPLPTRPQTSSVLTVDPFTHWPTRRPKCFDRLTSDPFGQTQPNNLADLHGGWPLSGDPW